MRGRSEKHPPQVQPFLRLPAWGLPRCWTNSDPGCYMGTALQCRCAELFFTWAMPWGWARCFLLWGEDNYLTSSFGACQGSMFVCAIRAVLGEPGPGLEGGVLCPTTLGMGTGGCSASEPAGTRSVPALLALVVVAGAGGSRESWWQPGAAWLAGPSPGVSIWSCISGTVHAGEPAHLVFLLCGWRCQPWCLEDKPSLCPQSRGLAQIPGRGQQATGARRAALLLWSTPASAGDGLAALSKPGGRAPHSKAGTPVPQRDRVGWLPPP